MLTRLIGGLITVIATACTSGPSVPMTPSLGTVPAASTTADKPSPTAALPTEAPSTCATCAPPTPAGAYVPLRVLVKFRHAPAEPELEDLAFRYRLEVARQVDPQWFRMRINIDMHPAYMATVLEKDPLICDALPVAVGPATAEPPPPSEPCVAPSTGTKEVLSWSEIVESFDTYPWFADVVSDGANYAGGMFSYRFYSDGSFEAVAMPMFQ